MFLELKAQTSELAVTLGEAHPVEAEAPLGARSTLPTIATTPEGRGDGMFMPSTFGGRPCTTRGRRPRRLPAISMGDGIMLRYEAEKVYGIRRETGAAKLNRLTTRHYRIIAMHLAGASGEQIHQALRMSISTISRVLNDPLAQQVINQTYKNRQAELDALAGSAIDGVRTALNHGNTSEKLAAVDKYVKLKVAIAPESNPMESAEDYARAIVKNAQNVQINFHGR